MAQTTPLADASRHALNALESSSLEGETKEACRLYDEAHSALIDLFQATHSPGIGPVSLDDIKPEILKRVNAYCEFERVPSRLVAVERLLHDALVAYAAANYIKP
jgi:hypothetical protein